MLRKSLLVPALVISMFVAGAAAAGGIYCMLEGRDVSFGKITGTAGSTRLVVDGGSSVAIGPDTVIVRIERIKASDLRPGDEFISRNGKAGHSTPNVVVYGRQDDVFALYKAMGHGTTNPGTAVRASAKGVAAKR